MRNQVDLAGRDPIQFAEQLFTLPGHYHDPLGTVDDFAQHFLLCGAGAIGDRVQGRDQRPTQIAEQPENVTSIRSAEDAELMLKGNHVHMIEVQEIGRPAITGQIPFPDFEANPRRIVVAFFPVVHRCGKAVDRRELSRPATRTGPS